MIWHTHAQIHGMEGRPNPSRLFSNRAVTICFCPTPTLPDAARAPPAPARRGQLVAAPPGRSRRRHSYLRARPRGRLQRGQDLKINLVCFHIHGHMQLYRFTPVRICLRVYQRVFVFVLVLQKVCVYLCMRVCWSRLRVRRRRKVARRYSSLLSTMAAWTRFIWSSRCRSTRCVRLYCTVICLPVVLK